MSDDFWPPIPPLTADFYLLMSDFLGSLQTPHPPLKSDIINGCSLNCLFIDLDSNKSTHPGILCIYRNPKQKYFLSLFYFPMQNLKRDYYLDCAVCNTTAGTSMQWYITAKNSKSWSFSTVLNHQNMILDSSENFNGTLPRNINGSSSFCKGPRTSKGWKSKDPKGPRTLRLCMSEDLCKSYYSHLYFVVVTFLTKNQNWCYKTTKKLVKIQLWKKFGW